MGRKAEPELPHTLELAREQAYAPLLGRLREIFVTAESLAQRWQYSTMTLANMRKRDRGPAWVRLPTGGIRYRVSDVMAAEIAGTFGPITLDEVLLAVAACPHVTAGDRLKMQDHLRTAFPHHVTQAEAIEPSAPVNHRSLMPTASQRRGR